MLKKAVTGIILMLLIMMFGTIPLVKATTWLKVKRFYRNADRLEETTENFTCNHISWRIKWKYCPWYGGSVFNLTVYKVGVIEPIVTIHDVQYHYILSKTGERYITDNNGTFFLKISAINIAYYYEIIIEQDIDSPGGPAPIKFRTSITLALEPTSIKMGRSTTITAKLLDRYNSPIPNQLISFYIGTTYIGSTITDSSGEARKTYIANIDAGTYVVNASYSESLDFLSSNATNSLIVNPLTTTLSIQTPSTIQGKTVSLKAILKDENVNPIQGMSIEFQLYNETSWLKIGSAITDSNGIASLNYTSPNTGIFQVRAVFNGTTNYSRTTSTTGSFNVSVDYTPPTISVISPQNKTYSVNDVPLTFTVSESTSWISYSLASQIKVTISGNTTLVGLSDGTYTITVYANDTAGNVGASEMVYFSVNTQPPEPFPTWIVAAIVIVAGVGAVLLVYFAKIKKTPDKVK